MCNLYGKEKYIVHIVILKLRNYDLISWNNIIKVRRIIKLNKKTWIKPFIDMNTKLKAEVKNGFEKELFKLTNNSLSRKSTKNVRKHKNIRLIIADYKRSYLVSEVNCNTKKWFSENLLAIRIKETKVKINKLIYLGLAILEISKTVTGEFWYDYTKSKYLEKTNLSKYLQMFIKTLQMMLKKDLTHQIMKLRDLIDDGSGD